MFVDIYLVCSGIFTIDFDYSKGKIISMTNKLVNGVDYRQMRRNKTIQIYTRLCFWIGTIFTIFWIIFMCTLHGYVHVVYKLKNHQIKRNSHHCHLTENLRYANDSLNCIESKIFTYIINSLTIFLSFLVYRLFLVLQFFLFRNF